MNLGSLLQDILSEVSSRIFIFQMRLHLLIALVKSSEYFRFIESLRTCIMASQCYNSKKTISFLQYHIHTSHPTFVQHPFLNEVFTDDKPDICSTVIQNSTNHVATLPKGHIGYIGVPITNEQPKYYQVNDLNTLVHNVAHTYHPGITEPILYLTIIHLHRIYHLYQIIFPYIKYT